MRALRIGLVCTALLAASACRTTRAPGRTVPHRSGLEYDAFGGHVQVVCKDNSKQSGELIGGRNDSIFVLNSKVIGLSQSEISKAQVIIYNPNEYGWGYLSLIATISNGGFAIFTGPLWILSTTIAVTTEVQNKNYREYSSERDAWKEFLKYSRFPQGVPTAVSLGELKEQKIRAER